MLGQTIKNHRVFWLTTLFVAGVLLLKALVDGTLGQIGPDSDDGMRLVQIRDLLGGQNWFDLTQYRLGPQGGVEMHWSRLVDLPILLLIKLFDLFMPAQQAEALAIIIWPIVCAIMVIYGVFVGARNLGASLTQPITALLLFIALIGYFRFIPGAIDHHNFQLGLIAISIGYALDPDRRAKSYAITAVGMALSLAIGSEVYPFIAVLCGFFALQWLFDPVPSRKGTVAMGLGFSIALLLIFIGTIAPENYTQIHCDSYSIITFLACSIGGIGLAVSARYFSNRSFKFRLGSLILLAIACGLVLILQGPQCLSNPLDALPEDVKSQWLDNISEAQPVYADKKNIWSRAPYYLGTAFLALWISIVQIRRKDRVFVYGLTGSLLAMGILLVFYQVRFYVFGHIVSLFVLAAWVGQIYLNGKQKDGPNIKYTGALAASIPLFWGLPGLMFTPIDQSIEDVKDNKKICYSEAVMGEIAALDPGMFISISNDAPKLLLNTPHHVLSGNYHRNVVGISDGMKIMKSTPEEALPILQKHKVKYFYLCRQLSHFNEYKTHLPDSLTAQLLEQNMPDYFEKAFPDLEEGQVSVYRFKG